MMSTKIKKTFTEELYTPYLDLTKPVIPFALHSYKPLLHAAEHFEGNPLVWTMQRAIPASFRKELSKRVGRNIGIFSPTESNITSEPWEALIRDLNSYESLTKEKKVSLLKVLFALGFYSLTYNLASQSFLNSSSRDELDVKLLQLRANAAWIQWVDEPSFDYNVALHGELYSASPLNSLLRFVTALHIAVFYVRWKKDYQKVMRWIDIAKKDLESIKDGNSPDFYKALMSSRFYRAQAFIPYLQENKEGALSALSESEYWANQLNPSTPTEELLKRENLFPLSESHGKTAVWAGELELAGKMYHRLVKTDPYDPKSHMEYAEFLSEHGSTKEAFKHYILANIYSPPGGDISIFMACQLSSSITPKTPQNLLLSLAANDNQAICAFEEIVENHSSAKEDKYLALWGSERLHAMTH